MGGLQRAIFGGGKSTSSSNSDNQSYGTLLGLLKGNVGQGNSAMGTLGSLLGLGDPAAGQGTLKNFLNSTGFNFMMDSGRKAITGSNATSGLFNSGATGKALTSFGQNLGMTKVNDLMQNLTNLGTYGLNSANTIAGAGQRSSSQSQNIDNGKGVFGSLFPMGLSDPRLKNVITKLGEMRDGLGVYEFEYKSHPGVHFIGVMADEVKLLRPDALGPRVDGFMTVKYDKIPAEDGFPAWGRVKEDA